MSYEWLRGYNRADVELPSGIGVTLSLVRAQETLIGAGSAFLGALADLKVLEDEAKAAETNGDGPKKKTKPKTLEDPSPEVIDRGQWFKREMVRRTLRRVAPTLAELDGPDDEDVPMWVVDKFDQIDFDVLADYALRNTPLPAGSQA